MGRSTDKEFERGQVLQSLAESGRHLSTAMILFHSNLSSRVGLGTTEEKVLELVRRRDHSSVSEIATHTGMAKNSISDVLDRLEAKGFISRMPHPSDGRKVAITATEQGAAKIGQLFIGMMTRLAELNDEFSTEELALIAEYQRRAAEIQTEEARAIAASQE